MGFAVAEAALLVGCSVDLISGPVTLDAQRELHCMRLFPRKRCFPLPNPYLNGVTFSFQLQPSVTGDLQRSQSIKLKRLTQSTSN